MVEEKYGQIIEFNKPRIELGKFFKKIHEWFGLQLENQLKRKCRKKGFNLAKIRKIKELGMNLK
jgi:hypothetical protein